MLFLQITKEISHIFEKRLIFDETLCRFPTLFHRTIESASFRSNESSKTFKGGDSSFTEQLKSNRVSWKSLCRTHRWPWDM